MKLKALSLIMIPFFCFFSFIEGVALAEGRALEQLLELFEKKGVVTPSEVEMIKKTLAEEKELLLRKEKEIADKEKALIEKEKELNQREKKLGIKKDLVPEKETPDVRPLQAMYKNGFYLMDTKEKMFSLYIGGLIQADYRYFRYDFDERFKDPPKDKFDLRRVRLRVGGSFLQHFDYKLKFEFEGAGGGSNLLDAYINTHISPTFSLRVGQFKEPFGLEQSSEDKNLFFAERSMGYYLMPHRDLGIMAQISLWGERLYGKLGVFNGDGTDNSAGGDEDSPELTGRIVIEPFKKLSFPLVENLQLGASFRYARIDNNNVDIHVKTTGLTEFLDVSSNAKFRIIRDANTRKSYGADLGWAYGPVAIVGEAVKVEYSDITTSSDLFNTELGNYYMAVLWMITGEKPYFRKGVFQPIEPHRSVWDGGLGALGLAFRYDVFRADKLSYENLINRGDSIRDADAYSLALNWYLNPFVKLILDATRTTFDSPLLIYRDPLTGNSIYSDCEYVFTGRLQAQF